MADFNVFDINKVMPNLKNNRPDTNKVILNWETRDTWFHQTNVCTSANDWWLTKGQTVVIPNENTVKSYADVLEALIADNKLDWAHWFLIRVLSKEDIDKFNSFVIDQLPLEKLEQESYTLEWSTVARNLIPSLENDIEGKIAFKIYRIVNRITEAGVALKIINYGLSLLQAIREK